MKKKDPSREPMKRKRFIEKPKKVTKKITKKKTSKKTKKKK